MRGLSKQYEKVRGLLAERVLYRAENEDGWRERWEGAIASAERKEALCSGAELERALTEHARAIDAQLELTLPIIQRMRAYGTELERADYTRTMHYRAALLAERERALASLHARAGLAA